jgi:hypothetical protein
MDTDTLLIRYKSNLVVDGRGMYMLGIWGVVKTFMMLFYGEMFTSDLYVEGVPILLYKAITALLVLAFSGLIFFLYYYIGRSAVIVGKTGKKKKVYLFFNFCLMVLTVISLRSYLDFGNKHTSDMNFVSFMVDLMLLWICADIFYSALRINNLEKKQAGE